MYKLIRQKNVQSDQPLSYCLGDNLGQRLNHGSDLYGQDSKSCQIYLAQRCAKKWDDACESALHYNDPLSNRLSVMGLGMAPPKAKLSSGEIMLRNTVIQKYRVSMANCNLTTEQFDPTSVNSPNISYYSGMYCTPSFAILPHQAAILDSDPVMNRLLVNPEVALDVLQNIKATMSQNGTLSTLEGTRLAVLLKII